MDVSFERAGYVHLTLTLVTVPDGSINPPGNPDLGFFRVPTGGKFGLRFDKNGKSLTIVDDGGKQLAGPVSVSGSFEDGLFPEAKLYPGVFIANGGVLQVKELTIRIPPSGKVAPPTPTPTPKPKATPTPKEWPEDQPLPIKPGFTAAFLDTTKDYPVFWDGFGISGEQLAYSQVDLLNGRWWRKDPPHWPNQAWWAGGTHHIVLNFVYLPKINTFYGLNASAWGLTITKVVGGDLLCGGPWLRFEGILADQRSAIIDLNLNLQGLLIVTAPARKYTYGEQDPMDFLTTISKINPSVFQEGDILRIYTWIESQDAPFPPAITGVEQLSDPAKNPVYLRLTQFVGI